MFHPMWGPGRGIPYPPMMFGGPVLPPLPHPHYSPYGAGMPRPGGPPLLHWQQYSLYDNISPDELSLLKEDIKRTLNNSLNDGPYIGFSSHTTQKPDFYNRLISQTQLAVGKTTPWTDAEKELVEGRLRSGLKVGHVAGMRHGGKARSAGSSGSLASEQLGAVGEDDKHQRVSRWLVKTGSVKGM